MKVFISAVTKEFGEERIELARALDRLDCIPFVQETCDTSGPAGLLRRLAAEIRRSDIVVAILGKTPGFHRPSEHEVRFFTSIQTEQQFESATFTQWEVFFALAYGKAIVPIGLTALFQPDAQIDDATQRELVRRFKRDGKFFETPSRNQLVEKALAAVRLEIEHQNRQLSFRTERRGIAAHAEKLNGLSGNWLMASAEAAALGAGEPGNWFASRQAEFIEDKRPPLKLPFDLYRNAEQFAIGDAVLPRYLFFGGAGVGKTTLLFQLLHHFTRLESVERLQIVPVLANCLTLAPLLTGVSSDAEVMERWLQLAIAPLSAAVNPEPTRVEAGSKSKVDHFIADLREAKSTLLILIDGLDELDPSGTNRAPLVRRLFGALEKWLHDSAIINWTYLATTRPDPDTQRIAAQFGLAALQLLPPEEEELSRIVRRLLTVEDRASAVEPTDEVIRRFIKEFSSQEGVDSALVYLHPLARYYREYPLEAESRAATRRRLMEIETESIVRRIGVDLGPSAHQDFGPAIRRVLIDIAVRSLHEHDRDIPASLSRAGLLELRSVRSVPGLTQMLNERLVHRLLHVLIYDHRTGTRGGGNEFYYRLPHNEYRDYVLAEGIFGWVNGTVPLMAQFELRAQLASSYLGAERVKNFMHEIVQEKLRDPGSEGRRQFAQSLVRLMNDRNALPATKPLERTKASPHGAMLSLLLALGPLPQGLQVKGKGISFQRTTLSSPGRRTRLPLAKDGKGAVFRESKLRGADLSGLNLDRADFDNADLTGASLANGSLAGANLRNVAMGKAEGNPTDLTGANLKGADLFNYRFRLAGFYHFWDLEVAGDERDPESYVLVAGSRGQLLAFDLAQANTLQPVRIQTIHRVGGSDEVLDVSTHPVHRNVVVITGRDSSVRILRLPNGAPAQWPTTRDTAGAECVELMEAGRRDDLFHLGDYQPYSRRAQFSASGSWLVVTGRDERIAFLRVIPAGAEFKLEGPVFGREHTGAVMCIVADGEPAFSVPEGGRAPDRFFTAGYDGRLALWREEQTDNLHCWHRAKMASNPTIVGAGRTVEIFRSLRPSASGKLWAGTELTGWLRLYEFMESDAERPIRDVKVHKFPHGLFALAVHENRLAVGLADGAVKVFTASAKPDRYDFDHPLLDARTNDEIVRSLEFIRGGTELLAATWDGCLVRFDLRTGQVMARFEYPRDLWQPEKDAGQIQFDQNPFQDATGISQRMREYLHQVQKTRLTK